MSSAISAQLVDALKKYTDEERRKVNKIMESGAKRCRKSLKEKSPKATIKEINGKTYYVFANGMKLHINRLISGAYSKGWRVDVADDASETDSVFVVHNRKYQLTHLLESGHMNRDGTRTEGIPHIQKCSDEAVDWVLSEIRKQL